MANAKARQEAKDSVVGQMRARGKSIKEIMRATGQNYTRVQQTLVTSGQLDDPESTD